MLSVEEVLRRLDQDDQLPSGRIWKSLRAFEEQRAELMATLLALTPEEWSRNASVVDMLGGVFERSVQWYAEGIARHERPHFRQIHKIVAAIRP
ncbi:MAG TPA: hypothetical protein VGS16_17665 [Candidatus Dormibacteraeota bacterium]|nr:hypothetical protein [Candidatus Dormibacteraeota bacterium]